MWEMTVGLATTQKEVEMEEEKTCKFFDFPTKSPLALFYIS
jgi:hypothetical protein